MSPIPFLKQLRYCIENKGRYMCIIVDEKLNVLEILREEIKDSYLIQGSIFESERQKSSHIYETSNNLINYMQQGFNVILNNAEFIYDAFFDVFNQNFKVIGKSQKARVSLGNDQKPLCFVHEDFRVFILMDKEKVKSVEPALLNRFNK